ncbi:hypothetical protein D915_000975 [Fasciola hepatica]|uniref:Uncharacterized protein n=1 Tax=Fasciola hepatica TaxID=6192 RepID=A0A4E0RHT3_FASHE|nr:hypothetical protein D915_000975 [Fasciola hepatica]
MTVQHRPANSWRNKFLKSNKQFFGLLRYASRTDKLCLSLGLIFAASAGVINPINVLAFRDVVNNFTSDVFTYQKTRISVGRFIILACVMLLVTFTQALLLSIIAKRLRRRLHYLCFTSLLSKDCTWYDYQLSSDLGTEIASRVALIEQGIGVKLGEFLQSFCGLLTGLIVAFNEGWKLSLVASAMLPLVLLFYGVFGFVVNQTRYKEKLAYAEAKTTSEEAINYMKTVFAFGAEKAEVQRYATQLMKAERAGVQRSLLVSLFLGSTGFAFFTAAGLIFWYGVTLMSHDGYQGGTVVTVFINILLGGVYLGNALPNVPYLKTAAVVAEELYELIENNGHTDDSSPSSEIFTSACTIRWCDVTFAYPSNPNEFVLRQVNFFLQSNYKLAIVGPKGSGKSTVFQLLLRHYEPNSGEYFISGMNVQCCKVRTLREHLGFVAEDPVLFDGTIVHNIRLGRLEASDAEIRNVCRLAQLHEFIESLERGYDTPISQLSDRKYIIHRWLITLARAVLRNPAVLLLDYPNLPLNRNFEYSVLLEAVQCVSPGKMVVNTSRYPSLVVDADQIMVLEKGFVQQVGNHAHLMEEENGLYATMMRVYEVVNHTPTTLMHRTVVDKLNITMNGSEKKPQEYSYFARTLRANRPELSYIVFGCISSLIAGAAQPSFAVLYSEVFDIFSSTEDSRRILHRIAVIGGMMTLVGVARLLACIGQGYFFGVSNERLVMRLRMKYFEAILRQEIAWFESPDHHAHVLTTHLTDTVTQLRKLSGLRIGTFIEASSLVIISIVISYTCSWQLTLVTTAFVPLVILGNLVQLRNLNRKYQTPLSVLSLGKEVLSNINTVRFLNLEEYYISLYTQKMDEVTRSDVKEGFILASVYSLTQSAGIFTLAAVFELGAYLFLERSLSVVKLFRAFAVMNMGTQSLGKFFDVLPEIWITSKSAELIYETIDREPIIRKDDGITLPASEFTGKITFNHVTIESVDDVSHESDILKDFSYTVEPGQVVNFVGLPGCGSLRIVDLVERFVDPSPPEDDRHGVYFDLHNLQRIAPSWIRSQCALISYESRLFSRTIKENIAYGIDLNGAALNDVIQAARSANVHDFINTLPEGYDTVFVRDGSQFSEGQQRRIALARALFRKPKVLLVDRFDTELDVEDQRLILRALTDNMHRFTSIIVPHIFAHASSFDRTVVLRDGRAIESGTFSELSRGASYFKALLDLQKLSPF